MQYRFVVIGDIHWGAMDSTLMYQNLELFLEFIRQMKDQLDFVIIAGDYFDYRLQLNSKTALLAIEWFDRLITTCKESNVKKVRMFKGTREHDNDQLEVFRPSYELEDGYFRLYNVTIQEELLPGLRCVFCPDENMNLIDYHKTRWDQFVPTPDIGFFHGNFDTILPDIEFKRIQEHHLPTMIYEYEKFSRLICGPLISAHWHVCHDYKSLFYVGSFDRWKFGEEEDKGFICGLYDTDDHSYSISRVVNPLARVFRTIMVSDMDVYKPSHFADLMGTIDRALYEDPDMQLKVSYLVSTDNQEALVNFNAFQKQYASNRHVQIDLKDLVKKEAKKEKKQKVAIEASKYQYIFDKDQSQIPNIIHQFILDRKSIDVPVSTIEKYIKKYLESAK